MDGDVCQAVCDGILNFAGEDAFAPQPAQRTALPVAVSGNRHDHDFPARVAAQQLG